MFKSNRFPLEADAMLDGSYLKYLRPWWVAFAVLSVVLTTVANWSRAVSTRTTIRMDSFMVDDTRRSCRVVIPDSIKNPCPLILVFHGLGDTPESMAEYSQLDRLACDSGSIVVYPAGSRSTWVSSEVTPDSLREHSELRFFDSILRRMTPGYPIDPAQVYVVGMSNGGSFAQVLMHIRSSVIAGVVSHSGPCPHGLKNLSPHCKVLLITGGDDFVTSAIEADHQHYREVGLDAKLIVVEGLGHSWSVPNNSEIRKFVLR